MSCAQASCEVTVCGAASWSTVKLRELGVAPAPAVATTLVEELLGGLDALGNDPVAEIVRQRDHRPDKRLSTLVIGQIAKRTTDRSGWCPPSRSRRSNIPRRS